MAIDNSNFSSVGSELPSEENIQPWSGEGLSKDPIIDFPVSETLPGIPVRENIIGSPLFPNANGTGNTRNAMDYVLMSQESLNNDIKKNDYGKVFTYDAGPDGNAFYERYTALGAEKFDEVGFTPFRNNEANFNANTTWWDRSSRMLSHSFPVLFKRGFIDGPKSFAKILTGDFTGADLEDAAEYEKYAAIGMDSTGGIGAFFNNTVMNFGYTAGIITEAIAEELAMTAVTGLTGGGFAPIQGARSAMLGARIAKGFGKFGQGAKALKSIFTVAKNPVSAQRFWKAVNTPVGKVINPIENTLETIQSFSKASKAGNNLTRLAKVSKTAGSLYRDARNINMAISESRLESGMVENDIYKELNAEYMKDPKNMGKAPDEETQKAMRQQAKKGGMETFLGNAGFIYLTNKITFNNITSPKGGLRNYFQQTQKEIFDIGNQSGKFGKIGRIVYDKSKKGFEFQKNNLKQLAKSWWKEPGLTSAKKTLGYFKANVSEGLQENIQEIISRANKKHYIEAYNTESVQGSLYGRGVNAHDFAAGSNGSTPWDTYMDEASKEFSSTGFTTFMSGFMMGTLAGPINAAYPFLANQYNRMFNKSEYEGWKKSKLKVANDIVTRLNEITDPKKGNLKSMLDSHIVNMGTADAVSDIQRFGTKKEALDAADEAFIKSVHTMRNTNTTEVFVDMLTSMKDLTDAELADAVGSISPEEAPKYRERIDRAVTKMQNIEKSFKDAEKKFPNPVDLDLAKQDSMTDAEYASKKALHDAWNESVYNYVFFNESFKDAQERMVSINQEYLKDETLSNLDYTAAKVLFKPDMAIQQVQILAKELQVLQESKGDPLKGQKIASIKRQMNALEQFVSFYERFDTFYNRAEKAQAVLRQLRKEGVENPTDQQVQERLDEEIGKIFDQETQSQLIQGLKTSHDEYINALAGRNISPMQESLDKAFVQLLDYYKLNQESRRMAEYINILHDPGAFLELALKNAEQKEEIQAEKDALNRKLVDSELDKVELNTLLNDLQDMGLQLDLEQLIEFKKDKVVPSYFTDVFTGERYYADTPQYREGLDLIMKKQELSQIKTASIDPVSGVEMSGNMKSTVEEATAVFSESPLFEDLQNGLQYIKGDDDYTRVSQAINEAVGEAGVTDYLIGQLITNNNSIFNRTFNNAKWDGDKYVAQDFEFTEAKVNDFMKEVEELGLTAPLSKKGYGINESTVSKMKSELMSFLANQTLASKQIRINNLKSKLESANSINKPALQKEIESLESAPILEVNRANLQGIILDVLPRITYESGRQRGNTLDDLTRDFFDPNTTELAFDESKITAEAFEALYGENGYFRPLKDLQLAGEIYIFSKDLTLGDNNLIDAKGEKLDNVAGSLDLFIVDKEGNRYIVDLKTGNPESWPLYVTPGSKMYGKFFRNSLQQLSYRNLYFNKTNQDARAFIFPVATTEDPNTGKVLTASRPDEQTFAGQPKLFTEDPMFIEVNDDIGVTQDGKQFTGELVDSIVPRKGESAIEVDDDGNLISPKKPKVKKKTEKELYNENRIKRKTESISRITLADEGTGFDALVTTHVDPRGAVERLREPIEKEDIDGARQNLIKRIETISKYERDDFGRDAKIANTFDNITGRTFSAFVGKEKNQEWRYGMPEEERFTDIPLETTVRIDTVYLNEDGNYVITSESLSNGRRYDVTVTPEGNVVQYVREGKIQKLDKDLTTDQYFFTNDVEVRAKTQEELDAEAAEVEEQLPEGFRYVEDNEVLPAGNYITRLSVDGKRTITNAPPPGSADVGVTGDRVVLKSDQFISEQTLPNDVEGMIIYATPGSGKSTFITESENPNFIDADNIIIQMIESVGFRKKRADESPQEYIGEFSWGDEGRLTGYTKAGINAMAFEAIEKLAAQGKTIFTGTTAFIPAVDFLVIAPSDHIGVINKFANADIITNFKRTESDLISKFGTEDSDNIFSEYEQLKVRIEVETDTLTLYNDLNSYMKDFSTAQIKELREMLDLMASIKLNPTDGIRISTNIITTFINDIPKLKIQSGQDVKIIALDAKNKKVIVKKSGPGNFKNITMDYADYINAVGLEKPTKEEDPTSQDEETTTYVTETLLNDEKLDSLDNKDDDYNDYLDESNDEDIFGC